MKTIISLILTLGMVSASIYAVAADPVELRGEQGVVNSNDLKKDDLKPPEVTTNTDKRTPLTNCKTTCLVWGEYKCVYGCDPPDENNTVHGCSPCYSKARECITSKEVCK